ncbi:MAG: PHP-associated domain-containing protein [Methanocorpusculum sp.]|jgi:predicted metal-dependent phosphoesterase TrpH|uniref:PHP-associated domain-containing protein n=1 Tax=Methanocorpusculum sp. TaxID=2058474 RepID=UPI002B1F8D8A|nr:PHP-associated domain-containing protein [Methanocorpusculum sp.]MEA5087198.1 PHP-associated domain-containing protein [Methanocorpusculum sp.]
MQNSVQYVPFVKDDENKGFDMHVHSTASDGRTTPKTLAKYLNKHGLSAAITDHNVISGVKEALDHSENIIPGIEVSALEGPHILVYFDTYRDLASYYSSSIQYHRGKCPHMAVDILTEDVISGAKNAGGFVVSAHPYGYGVSVRGVMKGVDVGVIDPAVAGELDGLEVICSGMSMRLNMRAEQYAEKNGACMTGGSDAHVLWEVGRAVSVGCENQTPVEFLEEVRGKRTGVCGVNRSSGQNLLMGACMTPGYIPYVAPAMRIHARQSWMRMRS